MKKVLRSENSAGSHTGPIMPTTADGPTLKFICPKVNREWFVLLRCGTNHLNLNTKNEILLPGSIFFTKHKVQNFHPLWFPAKCDSFQLVQKLLVSLQIWRRRGKERDKFLSFFAIVFFFFLFFFRLFSTNFERPRHSLKDESTDVVWEGRNVLV